MEPILVINQLVKHYGKVEAVKGISFSVEQGQIFGILGPNGSGKTTTLAMIMGILRPTSGDFNWFGNGMSDANRLNIGCLLETPNFYPYLSATDNLKIVANIKQIKNKDQRIREVLEQVGLLDRASSKFKTYSLGMKQRLAIAGTLLSNPEVLVLDEPTNGLDPLGIVDIRNLIKSLATQGKTIVIASHILDEMEKICTDFVILQKGQIRQTGKLQDFVGDKEQIILRCNGIPQLKALLSGKINHLIKETDTVLEFSSDFSSKEINRFLSENGHFCDEIYVRKQSLEQAFLDILES